MKPLVFIEMSFLVLSYDCNQLASAFPLKNQFLPLGNWTHFYPKQIFISAVGFFETLILLCNTKYF